ncbi:MAG: ABC transporter substrate-binding protein [Dermatophilaceae bacterium]
MSRPSPLTRRSTLGLLLAAGAAPVLGACSSDDAPAARRDVALRLPGQDAGVPTPFTYRGGVGFTQASYVYDTLLWKGPSGDWVPWLAERHERADDGLTHTFTLREGVTWSDGRPCTAADVAFTFEYLERNRTKISPRVISVPLPGLVTAVGAVDDRTVRFTLARPDWTFERFTAAGGVFILPEHVWSTIADPSTVTDVAALVGTGPFRITAMDTKTFAYRYEARDDFFLGRPVVRTIEHLPVGDPLAALAAGEVDQAGGVGPGTGLRPEAVRPFRNEEFEIVEAPPGQTVTALYWNIAAGGPLADPVFRRACAHAIDREALVEKAFGGAGTPGSPGLIPEGHPMHVEVEQYAFDRSRAERLLDDAGYRRRGGGIRASADGTALSFELLLSNAQQDAVVDLVVADLRAVGVEVRPAMVDLATFGERRMAGDTQLSVNTFGGTATDEQPDGMGKVYASTSRSLQAAQGYRSAEFDRLHTRQRGQLDEAARAATAAEMQRLVAADLPVLSLVYPPLTTIVRTGELDAWADTPGGVGGLVPSVNNKVTFVRGSRQ